MPRPHPCLAPPPAPIAPHHLSTAPLPPAPIGLASSASRPSRAVARIASTPLRAAIRIPLCRHRADSALIAPHRAHRAPPPAFPSRVASAPRPWLARIAPHASPFSRMREKGPLPGSIRPKCMLFEIKMATSSPHASIPGRNRAIRDAWHANLAAKGPFSRRGARNHAWREDVASAARPFRGSGMRSGRTGFAPCDSGMRSGRTGLAPCGAGLACLPHAPPCHLACARRGLRSGRTGFAPCSRASPSETRHAVPVPMHLAICAPHPSRQPRGPTASRKQAEQRKQLNAGIKIGSSNGDPIEELFGLRSVCPTPYSPYTKRTNLRFPTWITAPDRDSGATL